MPVLKPNKTHKWDKNKVNKLSFDWSGTEGEGTVSVLIGDGAATSYTVPQTDIAVDRKKGKLTNNTGGNIEYTLSDSRELEMLYDAAQVQYTLTAKNESSNPTTIAVFQKDPDIGISNVFSLAWFSKFAYQSTDVKFNWKIDYNFVWSETGELAPGVVFDASQSLGAGLEADNQTSLEHDSENGAYFFTKAVTAPPKGILRILQTENVPLRQASVGIGMSGHGTFVVQAQPNITLNFTPHPNYYIVAGNFSQGEVLDISQVTNAVKVEFPPGVYQMTAVLKKDNTWAIQTTKEWNKQVLGGITNVTIGTERGNNPLATGDTVSNYQSPFWISNISDMTHIRAGFPYNISSGGGVPVLYECTRVDVVNRTARFI